MSVSFELLRSMPLWLATACALWHSNACATLVPGPDGTTAYDTINDITWLGNGNLAATNRFGLPLCTETGTQPCVNPSGSMNYAAAVAWVQAMNAANYMGHATWQLPTSPSIDGSCAFTGPHGESFGFNCRASALGSLYYGGLGLEAPAPDFLALPNAVGPFINFQPYLYWSQTSTNGTGYGTFSFNTGFHGSNSVPNYLYVLPMLHGKMPGAPSNVGSGLQANPGGQTVYDPLTNITWLANANLAASNTLGLPRCNGLGSPTLCVNQDGAMNWNSADQFIRNMNAAGGTGYLGQNSWQLPPMDPGCGVSYKCVSTDDPMGELFYTQLGLRPGAPVVGLPDFVVGPFKNMQPYLYWACEGATLKSACQAGGPVTGFEWSFSFGNGFQGTDVVKNDLYVTAYFPGPPTTPSNSRTDCLFGWAERNYSSLFLPAGATSENSAPYYYRYYPQTKAYLGTSAATQHVYYLGPASNNSLLDVGPLSD